MQNRKKINLFLRLYTERGPIIYIFRIEKLLWSFEYREEKTYPDSLSSSHRFDKWTKEDNTCSEKKNNRFPVKTTRRFHWKNNKKSLDLILVWRDNIDKSQETWGSKENHFGKSHNFLLYVLDRPRKSQHLLKSIILKIYFIIYFII